MCVEALLIWRLLLNMHKEDPTRIQRIYENVQSGILVSKGFLKDLQVVIKDQKFHNLADANQALQEMLSQCKLDHENVVKIYDSCISSEGTGYTVTLVMECLDHDLFAEISERRKETRRWCQEEMWSYLVTLVDVFAIAQKKDICHRDVKPQNLFLDTTGKIKIGDWGSSLAQVSSRKNTNMTIQGSPYFLSPTLKRAMLASLNNPRAQFANHNPYKSDVYSLGLTMLYMAKLDQSSSLCRLQGLQEATTREIDTLPYSYEFKDVLKWMLVEDETGRPDFLELRDRFYQPKSYEDPTPRPSAVSTAATDTIQSNRKSLDPYQLLEELNQVASTRVLNDLFEFDRNLVVVCIMLEFFCHTCGGKIVLDVKHGCPSIVSMLFCSQDCLMQYTTLQQTAESQEPDPQSEGSLAISTKKDDEIDSNLLAPEAQPVLQEEPEVLTLMEEECITPPPPFEEVKEQPSTVITQASEQPTIHSENKLLESLEKSLHDIKTDKLCIICGKKKQDSPELLMCKKCIKKQEKTIINMKTEECAFCHKKWAKQGKISKLFRKKKNSAIKLKDCSHMFCSEECCFLSLRAAKACPICGTRVKGDFLKLLKFK